MVDILLVYPNVATSSIESSVKIPPLGLAYIASALEQKGYSVKILDFNVDSFQLVDTIPIINPKVIGITCLTPFHSWVLSFANRLKGECNAIIAVGGAHATARYEELLTQRCIDCVVLGEGEITFVNFVDTLIGDRGHMWDVSGIAWEFGNKVYLNNKREYVTDLDSLAFPARHLLSLEKYKSPQIKGKKITSILTSRGCPYSCTFCDYRFLMGSKFRRRSPQNVVDEIDECINKYQIDHFSFRDSTFTFNEDWIKSFCELVELRNLKFTWDCNGRVNLVTEIMLRRMKDIGCNLISYGIESGCQRILDIVLKHTTVDQSYNAVKMTKNAGIEVLGYFILGLPTDNWESIKQTVEHAKRLNTDYTQFSLATPFPGTPLYDYAVEHNFIKQGITWDDFSPISKAIMRTESLGFHDLEKALKGAYRSYYLNPKYITKRLLGLRFSNISQNWNGFRTLLRQQNG